MPHRDNIGPVTDLYAMVEEALNGELVVRDARWSEAIAVGSLSFAEKVKLSLGPTLDDVLGIFTKRQPAF